jgi:hypothetical protein
VPVDPVEQLQTGPVGQLQVGQDDVGRPVGQGEAGLFGRPGGADVELLAELPGQEGQDRRLVVHDQDGVLLAAWD